MSLLALVLVGTLACCAVMLVAWLVQERSGTLGWADVFWSYGIGAVGAGLAILPGGPAESAPRRWLVAGMVLAWALRLGTHVMTRLLKGHDDPRYVKLREDWGASARWRMLGFLQMQALGCLPLLAAVGLAAHAPGPALRLQDLLGLAILVVAVLGEDLADRQLRRFSADPANRGKVCDTGSWRWSRHPNYFFEWFGWLAYPVIAIGFDGSAAWGWLALLAPAAMYHFLVNVSGIPPLEQHMLATRGEAFRDYQARTSAFFPLPPRSTGAPS